MKGRTILIAEDEAIISLDLKMLLQNNNFEVVSTVPSGEQLISLFFKKKPDLIIADLKLKGKISGVDAISEIRKTNDTPIIVITSSRRSKLKKLATSISNLEVLTKPFEQSELLYLANKFSLTNFQKTIK